MLEKVLPDWESALVADWEGWSKLWMKASGCSRPTADAMRDRAEQLSRQRTDAILHLYQLGQLSLESTEAMLQGCLRPDLRAKGVRLILPLTYAQERAQGDGQVIDLDRYREQQEAAPDAAS